jgi:hypothetical protein
VYENEIWRGVIKIYPGLHAKFLVINGGDVAVFGSSDLTAGGLRGNYELNMIVKGQLAKRLAKLFDTLWNRAVPITKDHVWNEAPEDLLRKPREAAVRAVNERLAELLSVDPHCFSRFRPECAKEVASAMRRKYVGKMLPENCAAAAAGVSPHLLISAPDSAVLAGHYVCWARALAREILEGRVKPADLDSGYKIYEAAVEAGAERCPGAAKRDALEELKRLENEDYRDSSVRRPIPYRMLFLAATLPAVGCCISGKRFANRVERFLVCPCSSLQC